MYAVILDEELDASVVIKDLEIPSGATVTLLGEAVNYPGKQKGENLSVKIPGKYPETVCVYIENQC